MFVPLECGNFTVYSMARDWYVLALCRKESSIVNRVNKHINYVRVEMRYGGMCCYNLQMGLIQSVICG